MGSRTARPDDDPVPTADFRSDTVTIAGAGMRAAMAEAEVGDDVYGEDPTVSALQERVAGLAGMDTALFFPSATQANLAAVLSHCGRGEEYLCGSTYHVFSHEAGGAAALGGVVPFPIPVDENGSLTPDQVRDACKPDDPHFPVTRLLCLENTVSGSVQPCRLIEALGAAAVELGLGVHLDGSRLFNAAVAEGVPVSAFTASAHTVTFCLSKGLGAPVGAVLAGDAGLIAAALRLRKVLGGAQRQVGHMAAAGMYALSHNVDRLAEDHARASRLADRLGTLVGVEARSATNMVFVRVPEPDAAMVLERAAAAGVALGGFGPQGLRIVCHLDIDDAAVDLLVSVFEGCFGSSV